MTEKGNNMSDLDDTVRHLDWAADYCRARAARGVKAAYDWSGYDYERDAMLKSSAEMLRAADTFAGRSNMLSLHGLDYTPIVEEDDAEDTPS